MEGHALQPPPSERPGEESHPGRLLKRTAQAVVVGTAIGAIVAAARCSVLGEAAGSWRMALLLLVPALVLENLALLTGLGTPLRRRLAYLLLSLTLGAGIAQLVTAQQARAGLQEQKLREVVEDRSEKAAEQLDVQLGGLVDLAREVDYSTFGALGSADELRGKLPMDMEWLVPLLAPGASGGLAHPRINQVGIALPTEVSPDDSRHGPYAFWDEDTARLDDLLTGVPYDYTLVSAESKWYHRALREGADGWSDPPYYDTATSTMLAEYTVPRFLPDDTLAGVSFAGVSYASVSLERLSDFIKGLDLGEGGYAFLVSRSGVLASYPDRTKAKGDTTLATLAKEHRDARLAEVADWATGPVGPGLAPRWITDPMTGTPALIGCKRVGRGGWTLCTVMLPADSDIDTRDVIHLVVAGVALMACLLALGLDPGGDRKVVTWTYTAGLSLACAAGIGVIWAYGQHVFTDEGSIVYADAHVHMAEEANRKRLDDLGQGAVLVAVPTGLLLTEVADEGGLLKVSGLLWQRLPHLRGEDGLPPWAGVRVSNAVEGEQEEVFRRRVDGELVVGWRFSYAVPDETDDRWYPISERRIVLEIVPVTYSDPVLLVPDIGGYDLIVPSELPGLAGGVELPGWTLHRSVFSFVDRKWNVDLGLGPAAVASEMSSLRFEVFLNLQLINPLVTYLLPESIVFVLMFAMLFVTSTHKERLERSGMNAAAAIGAYGTLFFIAVLEHISLREALAASHMVYFEWFFIVTYFGLLLLTLDALLVAADAPPWIVKHEDNLIVKVLYWPALTGSLLLITVLAFYQ
ncbi:MAG: hypothetical protein Q8P41_28440 [Pseudomonadota bacterium]|nr:hypothetical protein [Pseudomonadota bacterium]